MAAPLLLLLLLPLPLRCSLFQSDILQLQQQEMMLAASAATAAASSPAVAMASTTLSPSSFAAAAAAAAAPAASLDGLFLLPWSIDLVGALSQVTQLCDVAGVLHLAQQWRQQEARARTPFLLLRILALTRAFELQEKQQHQRSHATWTPPDEVPLLDSLSRAMMTKVASYGKRLREYGAAGNTAVGDAAAEEVAVEAAEARDAPAAEGEVSGVISTKARFAAGAL